MGLELKGRLHGGTETPVMSLFSILNGGLPYSQLKSRIFWFSRGQWVAGTEPPPSCIASVPQGHVWHPDARFESTNEEI